MEGAVDFNNILIFSNKGIFASLYAAQEYLSKNGYSYGSLCGGLPVAVKKWEYNLPQKWKNLSNKEIETVDAIITGDMRNGPVGITFYDGAEP